MTNKEFKKILNDAGLDFDIFGYEGILNKLCILSEYERIRFENVGANALAKLEYDRGMTIYRALNERGYYDS